MKSIVKQSKLKAISPALFFGIFLLLIVILIAINPAKYSAIAYKGLEIWAKVLVPSLLPFFVLTKLLASTGIIDNICSLFAHVTKKLYNCPKQSAYVFLMSIITGYPVGSKLISDLYLSGQISKAQAIKTSSFCSTSGPMFILGTVAIGMFASAKMGYIILISHILGALLNGLFYRKIKQQDVKPLDNNQTTTIAQFNFAESIMSAVNSMLLIGGVICFTFVILEIITSGAIFTFILNLLQKIGLNGTLISAIFCGLGEITKGCLMLSCAPLSAKLCTIIATFIISFGGVSTFLQAYAFLKGIVPAKTFLLQKITHALCSTAICTLLVFIF